MGRTGKRKTLYVIMRDMHSNADRNFAGCCGLKRPRYAAFEEPALQKLRLDSRFASDATPAWWHGQCFYSDMKVVLTRDSTSSFCVIS